MSEDIAALIAFYAARLDEEEEAARAADPGPWEVGPKLGAHDSMVYIREKDSPGIDTVGITYREPVFTSQVPNKTRFRQNAAHIARHDPARTLRKVAAGRARIERYKRAVASPASVSSFVQGQDDGYAQACLDAIRDDAAAWSDHPNYRAEWKP